MVQGGLKKVLGGLSLLLAPMFLSTNFTPHIDLTMALSVLLKIAISISLKNHLHIIWK